LPPQKDEHINNANAQSNVNKLDLICDSKVDVPSQPQYQTLYIEEEIEEEVVENSTETLIVDRVFFEGIEINDEDSIENEIDQPESNVGISTDNTSLLNQLYESKDLETQNLFFGRLQNLKEKFGNFIRNFETAQHGRPVTKRDIDTFFESITKEEEDEIETKKRKMFY